MARYIDADKLIRDLIDNRSFYPAIVKRAIGNAPTEDVVPRSEVEKYRQELVEVRFALAEAKNEVKELRQKIDFLHKENCKLTQSNFEHLVKLVEEAEQEIAEQIFEFLITKKQLLMSEKDLVEGSIEFYDFIDDFIALTGEEILAKIKRNT